MLSLLVQGFPRFSPNKLYSVGQTTRAQAPEITVSPLSRTCRMRSKNIRFTGFLGRRLRFQGKVRRKECGYGSNRKKTPVDLSFPGLILTEIYRKDGSKQPDKVHQKNSWTHATNTAAFAQGDVYTYPSL